MNLYKITGMVTYSSNVITDGRQIYNNHIVAINKDQAKKRFKNAIKAAFPLKDICDSFTITIEKCELAIKGV